MYSFTGNREDTFYSDYDDILMVLDVYRNRGF